MVLRTLESLGSSFILHSHNVDVESLVPGKCPDYPVRTENLVLTDTRVFFPLPQDSLDLLVLWDIIGENKHNEGTQLDRGYDFYCSLPFP